MISMPDGVFLVNDVIHSDPALNIKKAPASVTSPNVSTMNAVTAAATSQCNLCLLNRSNHVSFVACLRACSPCGVCFSSIACSSMRLPNPGGGTKGGSAPSRAVSSISLRRRCWQEGQSRRCARTICSWSGSSSRS